MLAVRPRFYQTLKRKQETEITKSLHWPSILIRNSFSVYGWTRSSSFNCFLYQRGLHRSRSNCIPQCQNRNGLHQVMIWKKYNLIHNMHGSNRIRFLVVVWAVYKQMKSQTAPILAEVDEDNFDRAFDFLRPGAYSVLFTWWCIIQCFRNHQSFKEEQKLTLISLKTNWTKRSNFVSMASVLQVQVYYTFAC